MQLKRIDDTLTRLGLPRKTIGVNVTQIGFDEGATTFLQQLDDHPMCVDHPLRRSRGCIALNCAA